MKWLRYKFDSCGDTTSSLSCARYFFIWCPIYAFFDFLGGVFSWVVKSSLFCLVKFWIDLLISVQSLLFCTYENKTMASFSQSGRTKWVFSMADSSITWSWISTNLGILRTYYRKVWLASLFCLICFQIDLLVSVQSLLFCTCEKNRLLFLSSVRTKWAFSMADSSIT